MASERLGESSSLKRNHQSDQESNSSRPPSKEKESIKTHSGRKKAKQCLDKEDPREKENEEVRLETTSKVDDNSGTLEMEIDDYSDGVQLSRAGASRQSTASRNKGNSRNGRDKRVEGGREDGEGNRTVGNPTFEAKEKKTRTREGNGRADPDTEMEEIDTESERQTSKNKNGTDLKKASTTSPRTTFTDGTASSTRSMGLQEVSSTSTPTSEIQRKIRQVATFRSESKVPEALKTLGGEGMRSLIIDVSSKPQEMRSILGHLDTFDPLVMFLLGIILTVNRSNKFSSKEVEGLYNVNLTGKSRDVKVNAGLQELCSLGLLGSTRVFSRDVKWYCIGPELGDLLGLSFPIGFGPPRLKSETIQELSLRDQTLCNDSLLRNKMQVLLISYCGSGTVSVSEHATVSRDQLMDMELDLVKELQVIGYMKLGALPAWLKQRFGNTKFLGPGKNISRIFRAGHSYIVDYLVLQPKIIDVCLDHRSLGAESCIRLHPLLRLEDTPTLPEHVGGRYPKGDASWVKKVQSLKPSRSGRGATVSAAGFNSIEKTMGAFGILLGEDCDVIAHMTLGRPIGSEKKLHSFVEKVATLLEGKVFQFEWTRSMEMIRMHLRLTTVQRMRYQLTTNSNLHPVYQMIDLLLEKCKASLRIQNNLNHHEEETSSSKSKHFAKAKLKELQTKMENLNKDATKRVQNNVRETQERRKEKEKAKNLNADKALVAELRRGEGGSGKAGQMVV